MADREPPKPTLLVVPGGPRLPHSSNGEVPHPVDSEAPPGTPIRCEVDPGSLPDDPAPEPDEKKNQATTLVDLANQAGIELFRDSENTGYAIVPARDGSGRLLRKETHRIETKGFRGWLQRLYHRSRQRVPGQPGMKGAVDMLVALALDAPEHPVYTRVGEHEGAIYLNLCDVEWRVVRVDASGWEVVRECPVRFVHARGMLPLPEPKRGGSIENLRPFVNVTPEQWRLLVAWLAGALRDRGPYPVACIRGGQDAAKSTTSRVLRRLVDPNVAELRAEPKEERDLAIAAKNGHVLAFDNLPTVSPWLSDALCRLSNGGGFGTRENYSNDEETLFSFMRPVILNGIGEIASRPDLVDRAILFRLPPLRDATRRTEEEFWADFEEKQPQILGALLDGVATAIRTLPDIRLEQLPRMADFARWAEAAGSAFGWEPGEFLTAYEANRDEGRGVALEASPIAETLVSFIRGQDDGEWLGTVGDLLAALSTAAAAAAKAKADAGEGWRPETPKGWPANSRSLSVHLERIRPNLEAGGILVEVLDHSRRGRKVHLRAIECDENEVAECDAKPRQEALPYG